MPYKCDEVKQLPLDKLEEEIRVKFDPEALPPSQKKAYDVMCKEVIAKMYGEPLDIASAVFTEFEKPEYKSGHFKTDMTGAHILFAKKMDVMNDEFDAHMGALVADLIFKQHTLRSQTKMNLQRVDNATSNPLSKMLLDDLKRTEHLVFVDTALNISDDDRKAVLDGKPIDTERVASRSS